MQQWAFPALGATGQIQLQGKMSKGLLCLDASAPPPAPAIHPGRPSDAVGAPLAFINTVSLHKQSTLWLVISWTNQARHACTIMRLLHACTIYRCV